MSAKYHFLPIVLWLAFVTFTMTVLYDSNLNPPYKPFPSDGTPLIAEKGGRLRTEGISGIEVEGRTLEKSGDLFLVPKDIKVGYHDIRVKRGGRWYYIKNGLYVSPFSPNDFCFAFTADIHAGASDESKKKKLMENIEQLSPAFVLFGGDLTQFSLEEDYRKYFDDVSPVTVPIYEIPGNHETYSDPHLQRYVNKVGPSNYSFYFGDILFLGVDALIPLRGWGAFPEDRLKWMKEKLETDATLKFVVMHIPIYSHVAREYGYCIQCRKKGYYTMIERGREEAIRIFEESGAKVLSGHWHIYDKVYDHNGATYYITSSVVTSFGITNVPKYRWFCIKDGEIVFDRDLKSGDIVVEKGYLDNNRVAKVVIENRRNFSIPIFVSLNMADLDNCSYVAEAGVIERVEHDNGCKIWIRLNAQSGRTVFYVRSQ